MVHAAAEAGAQFIVSPILKSEIIAACQQLELVCIPGAFTPTEIFAAMELGADLVKVFPARSLGATYIRDLVAPLPQLRLVPTGGVDLDNLNEFLSAGAVAVAIGSQLVDKNLIAEGQFDKIVERARKFAQAANRTVD
jgi:2-dehydro-3-deoxyphosphogluconate aldolase/(4S)-4-hydroxy-2-oxoglutarate aldolase